MLLRSLDRQKLNRYSLTWRENGTKEECFLRWISVYKRQKPYGQGMTLDFRVGGLGDVGHDISGGKWIPESCFSWYVVTAGV